MLALPLFGASAYSDDQKPAATTPVIKWNNDVCEIIGTVDHLESVERSPWSDGAPSALSMIETDIWVTVNDRKPHSKNATAASLCNRGAKGETLAYKLCSPTAVKKGDRIHAIEGLRTGSNKAVGCLFDLAVISPEVGKK